MRLDYTYENIQDFYNASNNCTLNGHKSRWKEHSTRDDEDWVGLDLSNILKSKYSYEKGLDVLKELEIDSPLGGSCCKFIYDEFDGDDINYDKLIDGFPALRKRVRKEGIGSGKIINIYINVAENCDIEYKYFLSKAYTAIQIVDYLEKRGYRIGVYSCAYTLKFANGTDQWGKDDYNLKVCIKKPEDPLIKGLILATINPWFFRYHIFKHMAATNNVCCCLGHSVALGIKSTKENIYIDNGECLDNSASQRKIEEIKNLFNLEETM